MLDFVIIIFKIQFSIFKNLKMNLCRNEHYIIEFIYRLLYLFEYTLSE